MGNINLNLDLLVAEELLLRNEADPRAVPLKGTLSSVSTLSVLKKGESHDLKAIKGYTLLKESSLSTLKLHRSGRRSLKWLLGKIVS